MTERLLFYGLLGANLFLILYGLWRLAHAS